MNRTETLVAPEFLSALGRLGASTRLITFLQARWSVEAGSIPEGRDSLPVDSQTMAPEASGRAKKRDKSEPAPDDIAQSVLVPVPSRSFLARAKAELADLVERMPLGQLRPELLDSLIALIDSWGEYWEREAIAEHQENLIHLEGLIAERKGHLAAADQEVEAQMARMRFVSEKHEAARRWLIGGRLDATSDTQSVRELEGATPGRSVDRVLPAVRDSRIEVGAVWFFAALAAVTQILAFLPILLVALRSATFGVVLVVAFGLSLAGVGTAFQVGAGLKRRRTDDPRNSATVLLYSNLVAWLGLLAGLLAAYSSSSNQQSSLVSGIVVYQAPGSIRQLAIPGALYIAAGVLAMSASFQAYNPAEWSFVKSARDLDKAQRAVIEARVSASRAGEQVRLLQEGYGRALEGIDGRLVEVAADRQAALTYAQVMIAARGEGERLERRA